MKSSARDRSQFRNVYDDSRRAQAYATLEFPGTYYLAFRDLPEIIREYAAGRDALDFGCGAGRSTRFLRGLGLNAVGIDISRSMIQLARNSDPAGDYRLVRDGDFSSFGDKKFDLILSAFAFDNIPGIEKRGQLLRGLRSLLQEGGRIVLLGSAPEIYTHEWTSFSTKDFAENRGAKSGDTVRIVMKDVADARPVIDVIWFENDYLKLFADADLNVVVERAPLGRANEPFQWVSETNIAPWVIYVLAPKSSA